MQPNPDKSYLRLYTGMNDASEEFLILDLTIPGRHVILYTSRESLDNCPRQDLMDFLIGALNEASLFTRNLGIRLKIEADTIVGLTKDFSQEEKRDIIKLVKETKK